MHHFFPKPYCEKFIDHNLNDLRLVWGEFDLFYTTTMWQIINHNINDLRPIKSIWIKDNKKYVLF